MSNAEKIQQWRDGHLGETLTEATLRTILDTELPYADLSYANLRYADLRYADLSDTDLHGADLRYADLSDTDLHGADLRHADLRHADLHFADLSDANLLHTNLQGADLRNNGAGILTVDGAHPYRAGLVPTPYGWLLTIGCWNGSVDELRALIAQDEGWPEATGEDIEKRRPILEAIADLCDAHIARHADRHVLRLAKRWNR